METTDNKTTISSASADQTCKKPKYKCLGEDQAKKWDELDIARAAALENGDFETAMACVKKMEENVDPMPPQRHHQSSFVECERKRIERLKDPLHNDPTFRELLGIEKYCDVMAKWHSDCCRYDLSESDRCPVYRIPYDRTLLSDTADDAFVHRERISEEKLNKLAELWRLQKCLLIRLRVSEYDSNNDDYRKVAHYCRADALPSILNEGLRLCSLSSANDPTEGKRFASFVGRDVDPKLNKKVEDDEGKEFIKSVENRTENILVLQCSFSDRIDDLNQFRLYGRDAVIGGEGTGICLVFDMGYFDNRYAEPVATAETVRQHKAKKTLQNEDNLIQLGVESDDDGSRLPLYWVLYYDTNRDLFYHTPCQRDRPFCINPDDKRKGQAAAIYRNDRLNQLSILKLLKAIREVFADLKKFGVMELGWGLCVYLRHLVKDAAFRDEQEMRILKLCQLDDNNVQMLSGHASLWTNYCPILDENQYSALVRVIAGPKVKNINRIRELMRYAISSKAILRTYGPNDNDVILSEVPLA